MRDKIINFDIDSNFSLDDTPTMERIRHKRKLIKDTNDIFAELSKFKTIYPRWYFRRMQNEIKKDVYKGIKVINKKNPVFIEMPTLKKVGNGQVVKTYGKEDIDHDETVNVNLPVTIPTDTDLTT